jgi:hypothetical protein
MTSGSSMDHLTATEFDSVRQNRSIKKIHDNYSSGSLHQVLPECLKFKDLGCVDCNLENLQPTWKDSFETLKYTPMLPIAEFLLDKIIQPRYWNVIEQQLGRKFRSFDDVIASWFEHQDVWAAYFIGFIIVGGSGVALSVVFLFAGPMWIYASGGAQVTRRSQEQRRRSSSLFQQKNSPGIYKRRTCMAHIMSSLQRSNIR